jgi:hypothetical protein
MVLPVFVELGEGEIINPAELDIEPFIIDHCPCPVERLFVDVLGGVIFLEVELDLRVHFKIPLLQITRIWIIWKIMSTEVVPFDSIPSLRDILIEDPLPSNLMMQAVDRDVCTNTRG